MAAVVPEPLRGPRREPERPRIPGYEIEGVIGRGSSGAVYRARQLAVDREVALKVLHPELSANKRVIARLQREARTSARLAHPNVVSAIDMGETDGLWWYAMEIVDGPSLALRLRQEGRIGEREALRLAVPLCEALVHLWEHGVVHRDVKPANVLVDRSGVARLADLGLAFGGGDPSVTDQGSTLGTPHYISPEQAIDPSAADVRSDIWSYGATLFHAVCGRPPFVGDSAAEILSAVLYARIPDPQELEPSLSKGLALVLRKCLSRDPAERYQTPRELLADLERVRERRPPKVRRRALDPVHRRPGAARAWWWVGLAAAAGLALVLAVRELGSPEPAGADDAAAAAPSFAALESLAERAREEPRGRLAQHLRELEMLRAELPAAAQSRWSELETRLRGELREEVRAIQSEVQTRVRDALRRRDYREALAIVAGDLDPLFVERTGFRLSALEAERIPTELWLSSLRTEVQGALGAAADQLEKALAYWGQRRLERVDDLLARQEWSEARAALLADDEAILDEAGFGAVRFPPELVDQELAGLKIELKIERQALDDEWYFLNRELQKWLAGRAASLRAELEARELVSGAAEELREAFRRELEARRITPERVPAGLTLTAAADLERHAEELDRLEDRLLEEDVRGVFEDTARVCAPLFSEREYEAVLGLWEIAARRLDQPGGRPSSAWRRELGQVAELRMEAARILRELLVRVGARIRALDGREVNLRLGSILRSDVRIEAGPDPLADGFRLAGAPEVYAVRELAASELESLAGLTSAELAPDERLMLALFRFHEGRVEDARRTLRDGALPDEGIAGEVAVDLLLRVGESIDLAEERRRDREADAERFLEVVSEDWIRREPARVLKYIEVLLSDYEDLPRVRARRQELLSLRGSLGGQSRRAGEAAFREAFGPDRVLLPRYDRVRMEFAFDGPDAGAWELRDWVFDGLGWRPERNADTWTALERSSGPRLILKPPLDAAELTLVLDVEQSAEAGPPQLLVVSAAGFHVALAGVGLPGGDGRPRWLVGTGTLGELLLALQRGEGTPVASLLEPGRRHRLEIEGRRRSGILKLAFDGRLLGDVHPSPPNPTALSIEVRAWEPVRLRGAILEGGR